MSEQQNHSAVDTSASEALDPMRKGFEQNEADIRTIQRDKLKVINVAMSYVIITTFGSLPAIHALRAQMVRFGDLLDLSLCDRLESLTYALAWANAEYDPPDAGASPANLAELVSEGETLRGRMLHGLRLLAQWGMFDAAALADVNNGRGAANVAFDLTLLSKPYLYNWEAFAGKTPLTREQLERAIVLGGQLLHQKGMRDRTPAELAASALLRQQAFTLFMTCYDEVRAAVLFLRRRDGDGDTIAPSLYTGRGNGGRKRGEDEALEGEPSTPATDSTTKADVDSEPDESELPVGNMPKTPFGE